MRYLLDTDVFSALSRLQSPQLLRRVQAVPPADLALSMVTIAEIRFGEARNPLAVKLRERVDSLIGDMQRLPLGWNVVPRYAELRAHLERHGTPIGPNDLWLAALSLAENMTLVTGNEREFKRVPKLRIENWLR